MASRTPFVIPHRAWLHPLWLGCLGLLAVNDHVLKHADLLPGLVTGKISDFAGLIVAPALFAGLLGVRRRWSWTTAHVLVASVFAGLQLSESFANLWGASMAAIGFPWEITSDPWDLVALPILWVSHRAFAGELRPVARAARETLELGAGGVGLWCCVATSRPHEPPPNVIEADVYVHNDNEFDIVVRIRELRSSVDLDCDAVAADPGGLLSETLFGAAASWTLAAGANHPVISHAAGDRRCYAALVDADNLEPSVVFWFDGSPPVTTIVGEAIDGEGYIAIAYDANAVGHYETGLDVVFSAVPREPDGGVCGVASASARVAWTDIPSGTFFLGPIDTGLDGCVALDFRTGAQHQNAIAGRRGYLCIPPGTFPFSEGDRLEVTADWSAGALTGSAEGVRLAKLSEAGTTLELVVSRGNGILDLGGLQAVFVDHFECRLQLDPSCGTVARTGGLSVLGGDTNSVRIDRGIPTTLGGAGDTWTLHLVAAETRAVVDPECAAGSDALGNDIELVAVHRTAGGE